MVGTRQKLEDSVGLKVVVRIIDVLAEGKAWLARTGGAGWFSGSDIVFIGSKHCRDWGKQ